MNLDDNEKRDLVQLQKIEKSTNEAFKKILSEAAPIKLSVMIEVLELFSALEEGLKCLVEKHSEFKE